MTELKTLKDIIPEQSQKSLRQIGKTGMSIQAESIKQELKQEAIKWMKHIEKESDNWMSEGKTRLSLYKWIQKFFNITEEDLK